MKKTTKLISIGLALAMALSLPACGKRKNTKLNPETDALVLSTTELEGAFSPYFSTAATDSEIVGHTQISMLTADKNGQLAYGEDEPVVTLDYANKMYDKNGDETETGDEDGSTVYQFVIKKGVKFSDGKDLTVKDVLFNLYLYLDPVYTGSSTVYSVDIEGLTAYRSLGLTEDGNGSSAIDSTANTRASVRYQNLGYYLSDAVMAASLTAEQTEQAKKDIATLKTYFRDELNTDWTAAVEGLESAQKDYELTYDWQYFLLNAGLAVIKTTTTGSYTKPDKNAEGKYIIDYRDYDKKLNGDYSKENCISMVYSYYDDTDSEPGEMTQFARVLGWNSGNKLMMDMVADAKSEVIAEAKAEGNYPKFVRGIRVRHGNEFIGEKTYDASYDVLEIKINGVDPKAVWNFGFNVAPMHYYSSSDYKGVDYVSTFNGVQYDGYTEGTDYNFGFPMGDIEFFRNVVQAKNRVPMGAGPYKAATENGYTDDWSKLSAGFYNDNYVYYERNEYFYTTLKKQSQTDEEAKSLYNPRIKYLQYKVVDTKNVMNALTGGQIHFSMPNATEANISILNSSKTLKYTMVETNGYGYIGINANYVRNIHLRRAIMSVMDTNLIKSYYPGDLCKLIYRPMSLVSWVYDNPDGTKWTPEAAYNKDYNYTQGAVPDEYTKHMNDARASGCRQGADGKWTDENGKPLKYTFTIAGNSEDHPAYLTLEKAAEVLNANGWDITLRTNSRALSELATGSLTVWAAAWSSTIDPDMYQVYHMDSQATSVLSWGYNWIRNNPDTEDYQIVSDLSDLIDAARNTLDDKTLAADGRKALYRQALDKVMELAVELPTYQRNDLYAYNSNVLDVNTLNNDCTAYTSPLSKIWEVNFAK